MLILVKHAKRPYYILNNVKENHVSYQKHLGLILDSGLFFEGNVSGFKRTTDLF